MWTSLHLRIYIIPDRKANHFLIMPLKDKTCLKKTQNILIKALKIMIKIPMIILIIKIFPILLMIKTKSNNNKLIITNKT